MTSAVAVATADVPLPKKRNRVLTRFLKNRSAVFGALIVLFFILVAIVAPYVVPFDPIKPSFSSIRKAPSALHWFGTDELGRDILSRMLLGARASIMAGVVSVVIAIILGVPFGLVSGYFGGWVDASISRATDAMLAIPFLIAIGLSAMPIFIRLTRGQVLSVKAEDYVEGARAIGLPDFWILARYVFPNVLPPILVQGTLTVATAIIAEASLSFLGLGQQPPNPSWGSMLNTAKNFMDQAPWMSVFPGSAIFLIVLGFNLLGDGLRDALDPREQ
jgi:ABC-type dipeptide/oligopeptide/nickel transport system permease subunit